MQMLKGLPASEGIAIGEAFLYQPCELVVEQRRIDDIPYEFARLLAALEQARAEIGALYEQTRAQAGEQAASIFSAHQMFLDDPVLLEEVQDAIQTRRVNAEVAVEAAFGSYVDKLLGLDDEYLRARATDVRDVGRRLLRKLLGKSDASLAHLSSPVVILAGDLSPSDTAQLDRQHALGICTAIGGATSHTAIVARTLGLPAVVGATERILDVADGALIILDGRDGTVIIDPTPEVLATYEDRRRVNDGERNAAKALAQRPAQTPDGRAVEVLANIGSPESAKYALEHGAEGIGLLRSEFLFLDRPTTPSEEEQYNAYRAVAETMGRRPVIVRTLDIGGDKQASCLQIPAELNPFMGLRAIRLCLERPELFKAQLRAILRAGDGHNLKIMFPMIADVGELRRAKEILAAARAELAASGLPHDGDMPVGIMIEIPAAAISADILAQEADFFSIGTNDLIQYTMASDRTNERVSYLYKPLHPAVLRLIKGVIDAARSAGKTVGMCGEMAGDPTAIPILLGMGLRELSMAPAAIPTAKQVIRSFTMSESQRLAASVLGVQSAEEAEALATQAVRPLGIRSF